MIVLLEANDILSETKDLLNLLVRSARKYIFFSLFPGADYE